MLKKIGIVHSPFKEKFTIPRQPGLISLPSILEIFFPYSKEEALLGIDQFSHLWVIFLFHKIESNHKNFKATVRPPRLGGNKKQGGFATRSPYRPNNFGLSLVEVIKRDKNKIYIKGGDFLDQTPILDIKPYLKEIESVPNAVSGWTTTVSEKKLQVFFEEDVCNQITEEEQCFLREILALDPRPSYHCADKKTYAAKIFDFDLHWKIEKEICFVFKLVRS